MPKKVMVTGVAGLIGNTVWKALRPKQDKYDLYGLARRFQASSRILSGKLDEVPLDRWRLVDTYEFDAVRRAFQGMEVVVHMAADPRAEASWESVLRNNVVGAYNVFEACRLCGVKRIVYASTVMVSWGHQYDQPYRSIVQGRYADVPSPLPLVTKEAPVRPTDLYPASKVWGEALGRYYADVHGLSVICLRIGGVNDSDVPGRSHIGHAVWCSKRDIAQIVERAIDAPESVHFDIFYGVSNNKYRFVDIEHGRRVLGYVPQDGAGEYRG